MSLNFDLTEVQKRLGDRWEEVTTYPDDIGKEKQRWHPVTDSLIWKTMAVDLGIIKEDNIDEWVWRLQFLQALDGAEFSDGEGNEAYITRQDVEDHIGLRTNVINKTRKQFLEKLAHQSFRIKTKKQEKTARELVNENIAEHHRKAAEAKSDG